MEGVRSSFDFVDVHVKSPLKGERAKVNPQGGQGDSPPPCHKEVLNQPDFPVISREKGSSLERRG